MKEASNRLPYGLSDEIDLVEYIAAILRNKYRLIFFALLSGMLGYGLAHLKPDLYEAFVHMTLVENEKIGGGFTERAKSAGDADAC